MQRAWGRLLAGAVAAIFITGAAQAAAADWTVAQMSGQVSITVTGAQPVALRRDAVLPAGGILRTGTASRALLQRNAETISVGPNAALAVPPGSNNGQFTTVLQNAGVVTFSVEKRNVQHFSVETPYLAAVVKGTEFSVEVAPRAATVRVTRGVVEVTALRTGYVTSVTAGQAVEVRADGVMAFAGVTGTPTVTQGTPRLPLIGDTTLAALERALPAIFGKGTTTASLNAGPASLGVQIGNGASVSVDVGGLGISADVTAGSGIEVTAGPASLAVGGGGVDVSVGGLGVSAGSGGVQVDLGPVHLGLGH